MLVAVGIGIGIALRLVVLRSRLGTVDSDEAVVGLMARHIAHGGFRAFYWGQPYGGTVEAVLAAVLFKVLGPSTTALKLVPLGLEALAAFLVWRVGRRLIDPGPAAVAALLIWVWPANYLWWSTKERGFYEACLCLGLGAALSALCIVDNGSTRWRDWVVLGLLAGLGWWESPQVVYVLAPTAAWLVWRVRGRAWRAVAAVPAFALGAMPWLWSNLGNGFSSLDPPPSPVKGSYVGHLSVLLHLGLPMTLGLRVAYTSRWVGPRPVGIALYLVALAVVGAALVRRWPDGRLAVLVVLSFPFLHSLLTLAGTVAEGRYTLFVLPWLALALAHRADRRITAALLGAVAVVVTIAGLVDMRDLTSPFAPDRRVPRSLAALERGLAAHGVTRAWANYWVAYRLTFQTGERVIAAPTTSDRYPPYTRLVSTTPGAAHVFVSRTASEAGFRHGLDERRIPYDRWEAGVDWVIYVPHIAVGPLELAGSFP